MSRAPEAIDVTNLPEVARLAEEVRQSRTPRELRRGDEVIARIVPAARHTALPARRYGGKRSVEDVEAFRSSAGGWADIDAEKLKSDIYESRRRSSRPPVDL